MTCDRLRARRYQTAPSPARATQSPSAPVAPPARAPAYATGRARRQRARSRSGTSSGCSTLQSAQCCSRCERKRRHARRDAKAARSRPHGAGRASRQQRDSSRRRPVRCRDRLPRRPPCLRLRVRAYSLPRPDPRVPHSEIGGLPGEIARDALVATRRALGAEDAHLLGHEGGTDAEGRKPAGAVCRALACQEMTSAASGPSDRGCGSASPNGGRRLLAAGPIRGDEQAHRAVALMAEQPPASLPLPLLHGEDRNW